MKTNGKLKRLLHGYGLDGRFQEATRKEKKVFINGKQMIRDSLKRWVFAPVVLTEGAGLHLPQSP
jgi:hypothetical protein